MIKACRFATFALAAAALAAPSLAQGSAGAEGQPAATPAASANQPDPNEVICEKQEVVGSRIAKKRVCMTRAQWADRRLVDRQEIERVQVQRGTKGE